VDEGVIEGFLLGELLAGSSREGLAAPMQALVAAGEPGDRVRFARKVASRLRPVARDDAPLPLRIAALLGRSGQAPRRRYRPPPGLVEALHRLLAARPPVDEAHARGAGRTAAAHLDDLRAAFDAENAAAAMALQAHVEPLPEVEQRRVRAAWHALTALDQADVVNLGRAVLGDGDDPLSRGGRELKELEEVGCLA